MTNSKTAVTLALTLLGLVSLSLAHNKTEEKSHLESEKRLLPGVFNIVRFANDVCEADSNRNGTCYTAEECEDRGGRNSGSCAGGYGVCCLFTANCGSRSNENNTYFESTGSENGNCFMTICPSNDNICQIRLDFVMFIITGPSTSTSTQQKGTGGVAFVNGSPLSRNSQCLTDTFQVGSPDGPRPPTICGTNTGEHMYVQASDLCNTLEFTFGSQGIDTAISNRQWNIKLTQYACDHELLPPKGCTQYFYGATTNTVRTYNFLGGQHLANQNQEICVRRERGNCRICWTTLVDTDFALSTAVASIIGMTTSTQCCGYGVAGADTSGYDCLIIPNAVNIDANPSILNAPQICGRNKGIVVSNAGSATTICSDRLPFSIRFVSDQYEFAPEIPSADIGFQLAYFQTATKCTN